MPEIDVSFETPDYSGECCAAPSSPDRKTKRVYPTVTIPNNLALAKAVTVGQEFTATVKFRVQEVMIRERADGASPGYDYPGEGVRVELEVHTLSPQGVAVKEESGEEDGAMAIKSFFGKKTKAANSEES